MSSILDKGVLNKLHKYRVPKLDVPLGSKTLTLAPEVFASKKKNETLPFNEVVSSKQTPQWYSPGATNLPVCVADLWMLRECHTMQDYKMCLHAWVGGIMEVEHKLIFNFKGKSQWKYLALGPVKDSSVLTWPVTIT